MRQRSAFLVCATLALAGCGVGATAANDDHRAGGRPATCEAFTPYADLDQVQQAIATAPSILGIAGADIATSVRLPGGSAIFAFGDTLLDTSTEGEPIVRNSLLAFADDRACLMLGDDSGAFVPDRSDGIGYWPTSLSDATRPGVAVRPTAAMFLQRVTQTGDGEFVNLGPAIAEVSIDNDGLPHLVRVIDIGEDSPSRQSIGWGAASWRADDGYLYIYGTANPELPLVFGWSLHVARAPADEVFDPTSWSYWDGMTWDDDPAGSATLIPATGGVSQTLSVFEQDGTWYAVSKRDDFLGEDIVIWAASSPVGPFTPREPAAQSPSDLQAGIVRYAAIAHPTLFPEEGTVVVSISRNATDPERVAADPSIYRPEFFRVPLPVSRP